MFCGSTRLVRTTPKTSDRWLRILVGVGTVLFTLLVGIPTAFVLHARFQVSSVLHHASAVRLEEYSFGKTLTTRSLTTAEFDQVKAAIPMTWQIGIPGLIFYCWDPHHRAVITDAAQRQMIFEVCFTCDEMSISDSGILFTPRAWRQPLRQLFLRHDIPIRDRYPLGINAESQ